MAQVAVTVNIPWRNQMSKTLEETLTFLESAENGSEFVEAVKAELSKKNSEAKGLRDRLKDADLKGKKLSTVLSALELEDSEDLEDKISEIRTKSKTAKSPEEYTRLEKRLKALEQENADAKAESRKVKVEAKLSKLLHESNVIEGVFEGLKDVLATKVKHNDDGDIYLSLNGEELPIEEGVKNYLSSNPGFVKNVQKPGSGGKPGSQGAPKQMKKDEFLALSQEERMVKAKEGIQII